jgi:hypothetical protein
VYILKDDFKIESFLNELASIFWWNFFFLSCSVISRNSEFSLSFVKKREHGIAGCPVAPDIPRILDVLLQRLLELCCQLYDLDLTFSVSVQNSSGQVCRVEGSNLAMLN